MTHTLSADRRFTYVAIKQGLPKSNALVAFSVMETQEMLISRVTLLFHFFFLFLIILL